MAEENKTPAPENRQAKGVKVRAKVAIGEVIDGSMQRFKKGDEFVLPSDRIKALGPLVERVS